MISRLFPTTFLNQYRYDSSVLSPLADCYKDFQFRELTSKDFSNTAVFDVKNRRNRYLHHMENGHQCFGFENREGIIVSYLWLSLGGE